MADSAIISSSSFVRGKITGSGDIEIAGRVEGDVAVTGDVTVSESGLVAANVTAARVVVRGAVKGDITASEALVVEAGAKIVGDLRAPRIAIQPGGLVRGHVQTSGAGPAKPRAASAASGLGVSASKASSPQAVAKKPAAREPERAGAREPERAAANNKPPRGATLAGARPAPPPVVPVLKKGTKAVAKKR
ncbi:MAG: polymer-forming cytoskeletal protein [Labilithrix sp.]|nr:polymer-forming cytoskeletal protein [Labilithrix sp.]MCW5809675.1 polymer-forming cytoskeletal protein [Labilithrix sp.]